MIQNRCFIPCLMAGLMAFPLAAADWPQWRGPNRDSHAPAGSPGPTALPKELKPVWRVAAGPGFSSPVVSGNILVYLDEQDGREVAHALDAATGKERWRVAYGDAAEDEWGKGPRSTPMMDGDRVYLQSCKGEFRCLRLADGQTIWGTSYEKDFGVKFLGSKAGEGTATRRGNNGCGVIDEGRIVLPVGGKEGASLVCFDKLTGKLLWKMGGDEAAYSAFLVATLAGGKQIVAFTAEALMGVDRLTGKQLWRVPFRTSAKRHAATPVVIGDDRVTVNSHTFGLACVRISREGDSWKAGLAWTNKALKINISTPVLCDGHLYTQGAGRDFVCVDAATGELKWTQPGFGRGTKDNCSVIAVGRQLLVLTEEGQLVLVAQNPTKYTELGRLQVCGSTWSHPACVDGRLYVRDGRELLCLDLLKAGD